MRTPARGGAALAALLGTVPLLLGAGCANLDAVRSYARASAATAENPQVVADYVELPSRLKRLEPPEQAADLDRQLAEREAQRKQLAAVQSVLVGYLTSLGDMAADGLPDVSAPVDEAALQLSGQGILDEATATAAGSLAKVLVSAALSGWRKREVSRLVRATDPHLQAVTAGLARIATTEFPRSIEVEREAVWARFKSWEKDCPAGASCGHAPVARLLMEERLEPVEQRRKAAAAYAEALRKIAAGHAELARHVDHLDSDELKQQLVRTVSDLRTLYASLTQLRR